MTRRLCKASVSVISLTATVLVSSVLAQSTLPQGPGRSNKPEASRGDGVVQGRVTAAESGKPLRRAQLTLAGLLPGDRFTTSTNARGEYVFKDVPEGRYTLSVSRGGYLRTEYGERHAGAGGKPIQLAKGQRLDRMDVVLQRAGVIAGRLVDETGEPIAGVSVYAMRQAFYLGRRKLVPVGPGTRSDDTGQYRLIGLEAGDYYVMATPRETWTAKGPPAQVFGYAVTYFPGAANLSGAQRLRVASGQEIPNSDFALVASRTATLSGTATRIDGTPAVGGSVSLSQIIMGPFGGSSGWLGSATVGADGSWSLPKVIPGEFELSLSIDDRERGRESVSMDVLVQGSDISGISLVADPGSDVSGEVTTEGGAALPAATVGGRLRVVLDPIAPGRQATPIISGSDVGLVSAEGRFTFKAQTGPTIVRVTGLPRPWAIRSVEIGGRDYAGAPFDVPAGKPLDGVRIVLTEKFPNVAGTITDDKGAGAEGTVVLFSTDESRWSAQEFVRSARADQYGLFRFDLVRPGDYYAIALDAVNRWQLPDPEFLTGLTARATKVTVREGASEPLNLRLSSR